VLAVRPGRVARLSLVAVLLVPVAGVARASSPCAVTSPVLGADVERACRTVLSAVPSWDGRAVVELVPGDPDVAAETIGTVVSVHEPAWARLTPAGRQEVLTHELVHVATDRFTTARTPQWLVEGLAEAVALRGSGIPDRHAGQELAAAHTLPTHLPTGADFAATPALAYQESWLLVDLLVHEHGMRWVVARYEDAEVSARSDAVDRDLVQALRGEIVRRLW
jgi:hypothetical protein